MTSFETTERPRIVFGAGALERLGTFARALGTKALVVTDDGLVRAGHAARAIESLRASGLRVTLFDGCTPNPTTDDVDACLEIARREGVDLFVGLGGGSSLDTAKGANLLLTNGGRIVDYWGRNKARLPTLPMVAIPTTAGTGSEMQCYALISDATTHVKMACGDDKLMPAVALLDPLLTLSQPREVTATCGVDTLVHAVETAVTTTRNAWSLASSYEAFRLACEALPRVLSHPDDVDARGQMMLAAGHAGMAIEASTLGAAHSCANPLTARFGVPHGQAVGLILPFVMRHNAGHSDAHAAYLSLAKASGLTSLDALEEQIDRLLTLAAIPRRLSHFGVREADVPQLAAEAATQWTAQFNPRPVDAAAFESLYRAALG